MNANENLEAYYNTPRTKIGHPTNKEDEAWQKEEAWKQLDSYIVKRSQIYPWPASEDLVRQGMVTWSELTEITTVLDTSVRVTLHPDLHENLPETLHDFRIGSAGPVLHVLFELQDHHGHWSLLVHHSRASLQMRSEGFWMSLPCDVPIISMDEKADPEGYWTVKALMACLQDPPKDDQVREIDTSRQRPNHQYCLIVLSDLTITIQDQCHLLSSSGPHKSGISRLFFSQVLTHLLQCTCGCYPFFSGSTLEGQVKCK